MFIDAHGHTIPLNNSPALSCLRGITIQLQARGLEELITGNGTIKTLTMHGYSKTKNGYSNINLDIQVSKK
jgi:hypothetical protein